MLLSFLWLLTSAPAGPEPSAANWQPVHIWSDPAQVERGAPVRVFVNLETAGYLLVLRQRPDGNVDVLFPANPEANAFTTAGTYEITAPGGASGGAFTAAETGSGILLAALSDAAFQTFEFVRGSAWNTAALTAVSSEQEAEGALTEIVQRMLGSESFNYDVAMYGVNAAESTPDQPLATTVSSDIPPLVYDVVPQAPLAASVGPAPVHCQLAPRHRVTTRSASALAVYQGGQLAVARPTLPPIVIVQPRTRPHDDPPATSGSMAAAPREWVISVAPRTGERAASGAAVHATPSAAQAGMGAPAAPPARGTAAVPGVAPRTFALPHPQFTRVVTGAVVAIPRHR